MDFMYNYVGQASVDKLGLLKHKSTNDVWKFGQDYGISHNFPAQFYFLLNGVKGELKLTKQN